MNIFKKNVYVVMTIKNQLSHSVIEICMISINWMGVLQSCMYIHMTLRLHTQKKLPYDICTYVVSLLNTRYLFIPSTCVYTCITDIRCIRICIKLCPDQHIRRSYQILRVFKFTQIPVWIRDLRRKSTHNPIKMENHYFETWAT